MAANVNWTVRIHEEFQPELDAFPGEVREAIARAVDRLREQGPRLKRPHGDTLNGSAYANMKELRLNAAGGPWRVAYAFDPGRQAVLLVAGDKAGVSQQGFYRSLIARADRRFADWLRRGMWRR